MEKIEAIIKPHKLDEVHEALSEAGIGWKCIIILISNFYNSKAVKTF